MCTPGFLHSWHTLDACKLTCMPTGMKQVELMELVQELTQNQKLAAPVSTGAQS